MAEFAQSREPQDVEKLAGRTVSLPEPNRTRGGPVRLAEPD